MREAWVRTVAWRVAANRWRGARRWLAARVRLGPPEPDRGPGPVNVALMAALCRLPMPHRQAAVLHYLWDLPVVDVAAVTGAPVGTIKVRLSRARTALAGLLGDDHEEVGHVH